MDDQQRLKRRIFFSIILLSLTIGSLSRMPGIEDIKALHVVSLLVIGMLAGVSLMNVIQYFRSKK
jgi:hypothetical protein